MLQRVDDDPQCRIDELCGELREMLHEYDVIINRIKDKRLAIIVRNYYGLGWTDEAIAEYFGKEEEGRGLSRQTVQKVRSEYFNSLA